MLKLQNITKTYQDKIVVDSLNLEISSGEIVVIVGESGSGKTTLLNVISGNTRPDCGTIHLDNQEIDLYFERLIREFPSIKLVPQDYRLKPDYTIAENIDLALTKFNNEYRIQRIHELVQLCGLLLIKDKKSKLTSGGEKQRTAIARAIADEPSILLLDEPFSNLDSLNKNLLRNKIIEIIKHENIGCILVTHDLLDAFLIADKIGIMQNGRLLLIDTPKNIFKQTQNQYVKSFVDASMQPIELFLKTYAELF